MIFDVYFPFVNKAGKMCPGVKPFHMSWDEIRTLCANPEQTDRIQKLREMEGQASRAEYEEQKKSIPAICFVGSTDRTRAAANMTPTGLVMIDIDHCEDPCKAWETIAGEARDGWVSHNVALVHVTVGGKGLRIVFAAQPEFSTLQDNMEWFNKEFKLERFGKYDAPCKDFARLSFLPKLQDVLYENTDALDAGGNPFDRGYLAISFKADERPKDGALFPDSETIDNFTDEEVAEFEGYDYRGTMVKTIMEKWVEVHGAPGKGEVHNYYNDMVKNFRNIVSNNKRALLYLLPRFGHSASECWSSIQSICRVSTLSALPRPFYYFLKDNGFYNKNMPVRGSLAEYMMADAENVAEDVLPWMPPVFREFIRITPKDFCPSMVNALMPVMGTLASYLQAPYYYDGRMHTTSFFSIIYAPAGTGKGFVERVTDTLFERLKIRDYIQQTRENIYLSTLQRKGANDKAPEDPHTTLRLIPPKNSEAEFLQKMKDNEGYHMFTYAAEMDSWAKGVRAAGGNKDDMIRIAWDNGIYGQQFKSPSTFKGKVPLYWNVLITGTIQQLLAYFKNVENGLITRCAFTSIENQEFAEAPIWKMFTKRDRDVLCRFMERCDRNTYQEPCELLPSDVDCVDPSRFDEEVNWRFTFRKRQTVNMDWLRSTIDDFLEGQRIKAATDFDKARDVFRRRVAVRGFRLGLLCYALWDKPKESDLKKCIPFVKWWMEQDIESSLKLWGARYNNEAEDAPILTQRSLYNDLPEAFTKTDVYTQCVRQGIQTPVRNIIYKWIKLGCVKKTGKEEYEKIIPKTDGS